MSSRNDRRESFGFSLSRRAPAKRTKKRQRDTSVASVNRSSIWYDSSSDDDSILEAYTVPKKENVSVNSKPPIPATKASVLENNSKACDEQKPGKPVLTGKQELAAAGEEVFQSKKNSEERFDASLKSERSHTQDQLNELVQADKTRQTAAQQEDDSINNAEADVPADPSRTINSKPDESNVAVGPSLNDVISALEIIFVMYDGRPIGIKTALKQLESQFGPHISPFEGSIKRRLQELKKARKAESSEQKPLSGVTVRNEEPTKPALRPEQTTKPSSKGAFAPSHKKDKKAPRCALCSNCVCNTDHRHSTLEAKEMDLSKSDFDVERSIMRRLVKLEQQTESCINREDDCRRRLKRHRKIMYTKRQKILKNAALSGDSSVRFLPDIEQFEELTEITGLHQEDTKSIANASSVTFGKAADKLPKGQMKLTEMMGGIKTLTGCSKTAMSVPIQENSEEAGSAEKEDLDVLPVEDSHDVPFSRIDLGAGDASESALSTWNSILSGRYRCSWDRLFDEPGSSENSALDDLIGAFEDESNNENKEVVRDITIGPCTAHAIGQDKPAHIDMLSQRSQSIATVLIEQIKSDGQKCAQLRTSCPHWEENVIFALLQNDECSVQDALDRVVESKMRLQKAEDLLLGAIRRRRTALEVFEDSLSGSLNRLVQSPTDDVDPRPPVQDAMSDDTTTMKEPVIPIPGRDSPCY